MVKVRGKKLKSEPPSERLDLNTRTKLTSQKKINLKSKERLASLARGRPALYKMSKKIK